jgi:hypothetical protein
MLKVEETKVKIRSRVERKGKEREEELVVRFYIVFVWFRRKRGLAIPIIFGIPRDRKV